MMTPSELVDLKKLLVVNAHYYRQELPDDVLRLYAADLADLPLAGVASAFRELRREPGRWRCPMPADVRALVAPADSSDKVKADDIAGGIIGCISSCGYTNARRAEQRIGPVGWRVVQRMGGWHHLCATATVDQERSLYAQLRDQALAQLELARRQGPMAAAPELPAPKGRGQLLPLGEILTKAMNWPRPG